MDDNTLITYFNSVIKKTGKYPRAYKDWLVKSDADKTYAHLKEYWYQETPKDEEGEPHRKKIEYGMNATDSTDT